MSILLADNFSYQGRKPLDGRILYDDVASMAAMADSVLYEGAIAYNKETDLFYSWNSGNVSDATLGKWRELTVGSDGAVLQEYVPGGKYKKGTLFFKDGILYIAADDFTANNTEGSADNCFDKDVEDGCIRPLSFMPIAPEKYNFVIENAGTAYQVNDIVATNDPNVFYKVTAIGDAGAITEIEPSAGPANTENGQDAEITVTPIIFGGHGNEWIPVPEGGKGDAVLLEDVISNVNVGGITDADTIDKDTSFTEFVKKLLTKVVLPEISFVAANSGIHEVGESISSSHLKLTIDNLAKVNVPMNQVEFFVNGSSVHTIPFQEGQNTYTYNYAGPITENTTIKAVLTYDTSKEMEKSANYTFVKASYYGAVDTLTPDESTVMGLTKAIKADKAYTWNNATLNDQRFCYAYPASMGTLTSIKDSNNFEYIGSYTHSTLSVDGESYNLYVLTDPVTITGAQQIYK